MAPRWGTGAPVARGMKENEDFLVAAEKLMALPETSPSRTAYLHLLLGNLLSVLKFHTAAAFHERDFRPAVPREFLPLHQRYPH